MAPIRRLSAAEKGKALQEGPDPLPPKKRPALRGRDEGDRQVVSRPWYEEPPPGFPLPLFAHAEGLGGGDADPRGRRRRRRRRVTKVWVVPPRVHAEGSSRELVLHACPIEPGFTFLPSSSLSSRRGDSWSYGCSTPTAALPRLRQRSRSL